MKVKIPTQVLNFISENPGVQVAEVISHLPDINPSSVSSAILRLKMQGKITLKTGNNKRFTYSIVGDDSFPAIAKPEPAKNLTEVPKQKSISHEEWERRFRKAEALLDKGFSRRANRAFLELLDVTGDVVLRERIVICRHRCANRSSGDSSVMAGRWVGGYL